MGFQILTVATIKSIVFWDVTPHSLVHMYHHTYQILKCGISENHYLQMLSTRMLFSNRVSASEIISKNYDVETIGNKNFNFKISTYEED